LGDRSGGINFFQGSGEFCREDDKKQQLNPGIYRLSILPAIFRLKKIIWRGDESQ